MTVYGLELVKIKLGENNSYQENQRSVDHNSFHLQDINDLLGDTRFNTQ